MRKDFDGWNREKKILHARNDAPFYHAREIWWCAAGVNIGNEVDGTGNHHDRPVIIIRPFNRKTLLGVALIGHPRSGQYYFPVGQVADREATANLSQIRIYDTKRLLRKMGTLNESVFENLCQALARTLFPSASLK